MNKLDAAKNTVTAIVGFSTARVVRTIIANNTDDETDSTPTDKVAVEVSSLVLGAMVADATKEYTSRKIDSAVDWYKTTFKKD